MFATKTQSDRHFSDENYSGDKSPGDCALDVPDVTEGNPIEPSVQDQDADNGSSDTEISTSIHLAEKQMESNPQGLRPFLHSELKSARRKMKVVEPVFIPYRRRKRSVVFSLPENSTPRKFSSDSETPVSDKD